MPALASASGVRPARASRRAAAAAPWPTCGCAACSSATSWSSGLPLVRIEPRSTTASSEPSSSCARAAPVRSGGRGRASRCPPSPRAAVCATSSRAGSVAPTSAALVAAERRREPDDEHDDHDGDRRRDQERALAHPLDELAPRHQPDRLDARSRRHRLAEQLGQRRPLEAEVRDAAGGAGGVEHRVAGRRRSSSSSAPRAAGARPARRARPPPSRPRRPRRSTRTSRRAARRARAAPRPPPEATSRPSLMIATASHRRSTSSSWWRGEHDRHAGRGVLGEHAAQHVDADRIQPRERLVEHQQLGLVHERRGELHPLLVAERELLDAVARRARSARAARSSAGRGARGVASTPCSRGEVGELVAARASSGTARAPPACSRSAARAAASTVGAAPADLARVGGEHAEDDPHRGRLAGPVGADETEHLPRRDGEATHRRARPGRRSAGSGSIELEAAASRLRPARRGPAAARGRAGRRR